MKEFKLRKRSNSPLIYLVEILKTFLTNIDIDLITVLLSNYSCLLSKICSSTFNLVLPSICLGFLAISLSL